MNTLMVLSSMAEIYLNHTKNIAVLKKVKRTGQARIDFGKQTRQARQVVSHMNGRNYNKKAKPPDVDYYSEAMTLIKRSELRKIISSNN